MSSSQVGKCLAVDTPIPTPDGWKSMGDLRVGDRVFDERGNSTSVTGTSDIFTDHACYRIRLDDGGELVADAGHLWPVFDRRHEYKLGLASTEQMAASVRAVRGSRIEFRYRLACAGALELPDAVLPVDPYVLGAWLGDGHSYSAQITCDERDGVYAELQATGTDSFVVRRDRRRPHVLTVQVGKPANLAKRTQCRRGHMLIDTGQRPLRCLECASLHAAGTRRRLKERAGQARMFPDVPDRMTPMNTVDGSDTMNAQLRRLGVLGSKHIPSAYLRASIRQRLALLQGLLDTDGSVTSVVEFTNTNQRLAHDACELAVSLGFKARIHTGRSKLEGRDCGPKYRVTFTAYREDQPFRLTRKLARLRSRSDPRSRVTESRRRSIVSIEAIPSVPVRCIAVDSPSRLFLAGRGLIPTHNTECLNSFVGYVIDQDPGSCAGGTAARGRRGVVEQGSPRPDAARHAVPAREGRGRSHPGHVSNS